MFPKRIQMNPTRIERQGEMHSAVKSEETKIIRSVARSEDELRDELLEGIPNEITLCCIAPLLPRRSYEEVAKVNSEWQRAFEGRMIYDSRVFSQTLQTFFIVRCRVSMMIDWSSDLQTTFKDTLSLYSPSEERWYKFPPIPGCREGIVHNCSYVLLDCSIYLLGGTRGRPKNDIRIPSSEVLVLDLARHPLEWTLCANMLVPRCKPKIGVTNGKIFVFGGDYGGLIGYSAEVYDPKVDIWSFIAPMPLLGWFDHVFLLDQQVFACTGWRPHYRVPNTPVEPPSNIEADVYSNASKVVITVGDSGPMLIRTSNDNADDDMDGLNATIENYVDLGKGVGLQRSPADHLAHQMRSRGGHQPWTPANLLKGQIRNPRRALRGLSFISLYDPVKDEWELIDKERFFERFAEDVNVDFPPDLFYGPKDLGIFSLLPREADDQDRNNSANKAFVWPIRL